MRDFRYWRYTIHEWEEGPVSITSGPAVVGTGPADEAAAKVIGVVPDGPVIHTTETVAKAKAWVRDRFTEDYLREHLPALVEQALETGEAHTEAFDTPSERDAGEVAQYLGAVLKDDARVVAVPTASGWGSAPFTTDFSVRLRVYREG